MFEAMFGGMMPEAPGQVELGSIGWEDDDEFFYPGEETNDGLTLVRVQLFRGRDITKPVSSRAQGVKIICCVSDGVVPVKNARCYVAIPHGMDDSPGAGMIIGVASAGNSVRRNITAGDKTMAPDAGQALVISKTDGTVTIHSTDNNDTNGNSIFLRIGPKGLEFRSPYGSLVLNATGYHCVLPSGARFDMGGIRIPGLPGALSSSFDSYIRLQAATVRVGGGVVYLGQGSYYQPAVSTLPIDTNLFVTGIVTTPGGPQPNLVGTGSVWVAAKSP